jgi:hypothetical protein
MSGPSPSTDESVAPLAETEPPDTGGHRHGRLTDFWAAELVELIGHAAHDYVRSLFQHAPIDTPDTTHDDVAHKMAGDLGGRMTIHEIRGKMSQFLAEIRRPKGRVD